MKKLIVSATHQYKYLGDGNYELYTDQPMFVEFASEYFETREEAEDFAALFPKSAKLHAVSVSSVSWDGVKFMVKGRTDLGSNGVNKGVNETGVKRYRSTMKAAEKAGLDVGWSDGLGAVNGYKSREQFEGAL